MCFGGGRLTGDALHPRIAPFSKLGEMTRLPGSTVGLAGPNGRFSHTH